MIKNKKILIIRLSALGDVVFNIPLANVLKNEGAIVHWLVCEKGYKILENNPCVDKVIFAPLEKWKKEKNKIQNCIEFYKIIKQIRHEKYDIVLDTHMLLKSMFWTMFCNAKRKIMSKSAREFSFLAANELIEPIFDGFKVNVIDAYLKYAKYLKINNYKIQKTMPEIPLDCVNYVDNLLSSFDKTKPLLLIAPATTWENKHWNKDNWRELLSKINKDKFNIALIGTYKDEELLSYIAQGNFLNLTGKTNLLQLLELFKRTDYLISLDSGSTHLAWLSDKPKILSIFCATPTGLYAPKGDKYVSISGNLPCQPCHKRKCPLKTNECTKYPTVNEVLNSFNNLINDNF